MTQALERSRSIATEPHLAVQMWGRERLEVLRQQIAPGASDAELDLFATVCRRTGLDPFAKQIWSIQRKRKNVDTNRWEAYQVIQIGVHGLRLIAARTREYAGQDGPYYCAKDGAWTDTWLGAEPPAAARVGVRRRGFAEPVFSVAVWDRAVQRDAQGNPMALWKTRGAEQLALAAERDALRRAFPIETADLEAVVDQEEIRDRSRRYDEIFAEDDVVVSGDHLVNRTTGEVEPQRAVSDDDRAHAIVDQAHRAAQQRQQDLAEIDRQRREEGLL